MYSKPCLLISIPFEYPGRRFLEAREIGQDAPDLDGVLPRHFLAPEIESFVPYEAGANLVQIFLARNPRMDDTLTGVFHEIPLLRARNGVIQALWHGKWMSPPVQ